MNWIVFAASLAAVLALAGIAWLLKLGRGATPFVDADAACRSAEEALSGFAAKQGLLGVDRLAALVVGREGRVAVLKAHGAHVAAREVRWSDVRAVHGGIRVDTGERRFGTVYVNGIDILDIRRAGGDDWRAN